MEKLAAKFIWPDNLFMPEDLKAYLESDAFRGKTGTWGIARQKWRRIVRRSERAFQQVGNNRANLRRVACFRLAFTREGTNMNVS